MGGKEINGKRRWTIDSAMSHSRVICAKDSKILFNLICYNWSTSYIARVETNTAWAPVKDFIVKLPVCNFLLYEKAACTCMKYVLEVSVLTAHATN